MGQIKLPYRKNINWFFLLFFGCQLPVFVFLILKGEKVQASINGIMFYALPAIFSLLSLTQFFQFKSDEKVSGAKAWIKIPIPEPIILLIAGMFSFAIVGGLMCFFEGDPNNGIELLLVGLPITTILLLAVNSRKIWFKDQLIPELSKQKLEKKYADPGLFIYSDEGFVYSDKKKSFKCDWGEVLGVLAYKTDNIYFDTIHIQLKKENGEEFAIHEDIPGWYIFKDRLSENLNGMDKFWELKTMSPPFEESVTLVFEKGKDLMADWGKEKSSKKDH